MSQATVTAVTGNAVIVKADGTTRALQVGEVVQRGDVIRTQAGARVELLLADGQTLAMGPNQALRVDETVALTDATPQAADAAVQPTTVAEIVQILEQGLDLLEQVDPAAAGAVAAGAGEGSDFVRLLRVTEPVDPLAFQFNAAAADVDDVIEGAPAPVTVDLAFTLEEESNPLLEGNDETEDGLPFTLSGNFLTGIGGFLSSFSVPGLGFIAIAPGGSTLAFDANGQVIPPGATTAPAVLLFVQPDGTYTLTVVGALNHPTSGSLEELLALSPIALVGTAGTGGYLTINLQLNVQDDVPVAVQDEGEGGLVPRADAIELDEDGLPNGNADDSRVGESAGSGSTIASGNIVDNVNWGADGFGRVTGVSWSGGSAAVQPNSSATLYINANGSLGTTDSAAIRLTLGADGTYEFELLRAQTHGIQGEDLQALLQGGFTISAVDGDGDPIVGGVRVNVDVLDDIPVIDLVGRIPDEEYYFDDTSPSNGYGPLPSPQLTVDETDFELDYTSDPGTVHFTVSFGADGPALGGGKLYTLEAEAGDETGLIDTTSGQAVLITVDANGNVRGVVTENGTEQTVFVMSVDATTGVVSFDQQRAVVHGDDTDPNDSVSIWEGVISLRLTATDADGDTATATVDVGRLVSIADDGPILKQDVTDSVTLDEDGLTGANRDADPARPGEEPGSGSTSASGSIVDNVNWGADGFGRVTGVMVGSTAATFDTNARTYTISNADYTLVVQEDGDYTITLNRAQTHGPQGEDLKALLEQGFTVNAVDGDGDAVPNGVTVNVNVLDDIPVIQVADTQALRESFEGFAPGLGNGSWTVVGEGGHTLIGNDGIVWTLNAAGIEIQRDNVGGALPSDGRNKAELDANNDAGGSPSTLSVLSTRIDVPGSTFGMSFDYQPRPADLADSGMTVSFNGVQVTISADANGVVNINAPVGVSATQSTVSSTGWTSISLVFDGVTPGLQTLSFAGLSDNLNGDTLGAYLDNIRLSANNPLLVDETFMGTDASGGGAAQRFTVSFGADGAAASNGGKAYNLVANTGTPTGLTDTASGQAVLISVDVSGDVHGVVTVDNVVQTVFIMSVDADTGEVTFDQQRAVVHGNANDPNDSVSLAAGVISLRLTATDADGDTATATVDVGRLVSIADDGPSLKEGVTDTHTLDEDDLRALRGTGESEGNDGMPELLSASGTIVDNVNWGADGFGRVTGVSWTIGTTTTTVPVEGPVTIHLGAQGQVLTNATGAAVSLQVNANGSYTVTLLDNLLISGEGENVVSLLQSGFTFQAVDGDGDAVPGGVTVRIDIIDDVPVAVAERSVSATVAENDINTRLSSGTSPNDGNADGSLTGGPGQDRGPAQVSGSLATLVSFGADGAGANGFGLATDFTALASQNLSSKGAGLSYTVSGNTLTATAGTGDAARTVFTLELQPNGNYTFRLFDQLDHATGQGANSLALDLSSVIRATDADGDALTLSQGFTLNVTDDVPKLDGWKPAGGTVEEEALPGGNREWPNLGLVESGSVSGQVEAGADEGLTFSLNPVTTGLPTLTSGGVAVTYAVSGNTLTASAGNTTVFTLVLQTNGGYTFTLRAPIDHASGNGENSRTLDLSSAIVATDFDGDALALSNALSIVVIDDIPRDPDIEGPTWVREDAASSITGTWRDAVGADQAGSSIVVRVGSQDHVLGSPIAVTVGNQNIGTLTVISGGTWSFDPNPNLNNPSGVSFDFSVRVTDADGDTQSDSHRITVKDGTDPRAGGPVTLALDEEALGNANASGSNPASTLEQVQASVSFTAGSDDLSGFAFSTSLAQLVRNTNAVVTGDELVWTRSTDGQTVTATFANTTQVALTLTLSAPTSIAHGQTGNVTVTATLSDNLRHAVGNGEQVLNLGSIGVVATDRDGDAATATFNLSVKDDVPSITTSPTQALRESFEGFVTNEPNQGGWFVVGEGGRTLTGNDGIVWTLNAAGIEIQRGDVGGALPSDGNNKAELEAHNLAGGSASPNTLSVLTTRIDVPGSTFGMSFDYQPRPADLADSGMTVSFNGVQVTISADANGVVNINAPVGVSATQSTVSSTGWTSISLVFDGVTPGLQTLSFAGLSDNLNGDTLGAYLDNIRLSANNPLLVDETFMGTDASGGGAAQRFTVSFGADGAAASNGGKAYNLVANTGTPTGLTDTATGQAVLTKVDSGSTVRGVVTVSGDEQTVFVMSVDATTGVVTFDQQRAVRHPDGTNPNDSVSLAAGVISLRLTATDGDGDTATAMVDVGRLVSILDDAPQARNDTDSTASGVAVGNVITGVGTTTTTTDAGADVPGADGATVTHINGSPLIFASDSVWSDWINGSHGKIRFQADGDYEYQATAPVPSTPVTASYGNQSSSNVSVTAYTLGQSFFNASGQFASGGTGTVSSGGSGGNHFGVAGTSGPNTAVPAQINYSGSLSEALAFTFTGGAVSSATVSVSNLFQNEPSAEKGEAARWHAFDANGVRIGTGIISNNDSGEPYAGTTTVVWTDNAANKNVGTFTVSGIGAFSTLVIEALPYSENGSLKNDDSDFFARVLSFQPQPPTTPQSDVFNYTLSDGDGDGSSATLTIQSSPQGQTGTLVNLAPVAEDNIYVLAAKQKEVTGNIILDDQGGGGAASGRDWDPDTPVLNLSVDAVIVNGTAITVPADGTTVALAHGTLTIHPNGSYTYKVGVSNSKSDEFRIDSFEYVLRDVHGALSAPATVEFELLETVGEPIDDHGAWFIAHQGNNNNSQTYKLKEGEGDDKGSLHTFNVQFNPSNDPLKGKVDPGQKVTVVFDITGDAGPGDFNVVGVDPRSKAFSATWELSANETGPGSTLSVTLQNISGSEATLQGRPFNVTVQALADRVRGEGDEVLKFELNASLTDRGVREGNDFIQYTIEDEKAADTVFRFNMEDDTRGTAHVAGFDGKDVIEIHMEDVLDLKSEHHSVEKLLAPGGIVAFTESNSQNSSNSTLTINSTSGETQTIHFDRSFALNDLQLNVSLSNDILKFTHNKD